MVDDKAKSVGASGAAMRETNQELQDIDEEKQISSPPSRQLSSLEVIQRPAATNNSKPFLITRILRTFLPRSCTSFSDDATPLMPDAPTRLQRIIDGTLYSSFFRLIWASALGYPLKASDFPRLSRKRHVVDRTIAFNTAFARYRGNRTSKHGSSSPKASRMPLLFALLSVFKPQVIEGLICNGLWVGISMAGVLIYKVLLGYLVRAYDHSGGNSFGEGLLYILAIEVVIMVGVILQMRGTYIHSLAGSEMRTLCAAAVTQKSLIISPLAVRKMSIKYDPRDPKLEEAINGENEEEEGPDLNWSTGTVLNLVNTDTERIQIAMKEMNKSWNILIAYPMVIGLSYWLIGWTGAASFSISLLFMIPVVPLIRSLSKLRMRLNAATDMRVSTVNDLINGIRLLKAYAWEEVYGRLVRLVRRREANLNKARIFRSGIVAVLSECTGRAPPLLGVGLYSVVFGINVLNSPDVLVFVMLYYMVGMFAATMPESIVYLIDAWLSICRIQEYLLAEEFGVAKDLKIANESESCDEVKIKGEGNAIEACAAEFTWTPRLDQGPLVQPDVSEEKALGAIRAGNDFVLHPVTISIRKGELIAIAGATAAGKTSLAAALAGCMPLINGQIARQALPIYAPYIPWIKSSTVRENILFGMPFDIELYGFTLQVCALDMDLARFESGDMTNLGEKGITLSGGQRARVGLARATYSMLLSSSQDPKPADLSDPRSSPRDTIIMDDPLSALDAKTSEDIFQHAILKAMSGVARILVTHQTQVLSRCDRVIWMEHGSIRAIGPFSEIMETEESFRKFMGEQSPTSDNHVTDDDDETADEAKTQLIPQIRNQQGNTLILDEEVQKNSVPWRLYATYTRFSKYWPYCLLMLLIYIISQILNVFWGISFAWWTSRAYGLSNAVWASIVVSTFISQLVLMLTTLNGVQAALINCSEKAGNRALEGVLRAPVAFLDTTPVGRIINRFTQDINILDNVFPPMTWWAIRSMFHAGAIIGFTIYYVPLVATIVLPWICIAAILTLFYRPTPLAIKRIEAPLSSHVLSCISEIISGASTLRVSSLAQNEFIDELHKRIDAFNKVHLTFFACHGWITIRSSFVSCIFYFIVGLLALRLRHSVLPGVLVALLVSCFDVLRCVAGVIDALADVQRGLNCMERLDHYAKGIGAERQIGTSHSPTQKSVSKDWPSHGAIKFSNLSARYRPNLALALRDVNLSIRPGEKVGIVGRTGAGKSTLFSLLLAFIDPAEGEITIDDVDITSLSVDTLRQALTVIPQEPTLFVGTVRSNLDPRCERTDAELWDVLRAVGLARPNPASEQLHQKDTMTAGKKQKKSYLRLTTAIFPGGQNLSSGERQLLSLARALVRRSRVILIDEATASVDHESDMKIQRLLRTASAPASSSTSSEEEKSVGADDDKRRDERDVNDADNMMKTTVLVIAHRIRTVMDCDTVIVLERGRVVEVGSPVGLWDGSETLEDANGKGHEKGQGKGLFRQLCETSGVTREELGGG